MYNYKPGEIVVDCIDDKWVKIDNLGYSEIWMELPNGVWIDDGGPYLYFRRFSQIRKIEVFKQSTINSR